jgi:hypothetical protein
MRQMCTYLFSLLIYTVRLASTLSLALALTACGGGQAPEESNSKQISLAATSVAATSSVNVTNAIKLSETRFSRTVYDYVFRITVVNNGPAQTGVTAKLTAAGAGTTIIDSDVYVGNIAAGTTANPTDTVTIRHDRTQPFNLTALTWNVTSDVSPPQVVGILISGLPSTRAVEMLNNFIASRTPGDLTIKRETGNNYYANIVKAAINPNATVAQVNAALSATGVRLAFSINGSSAVTLQVPNTENLAALHAICDALLASNAFVIATPSYIPDTKVLFGGTDPTLALTPTGPYFHHVASRVVQAWNTRNAEKLQIDGVELILVDRTSPTPKGVIHAAAVAGVWAQPFTAPDNVSGVLQLNRGIDHLIDLDATKTVVEAKMSVDEYTISKLIAIFTAQPSKKYVINFSLGYEEPRTVSAEDLKSDAIWWRLVTRTAFGASFQYEKQVLQVSSAGNETRLDAKLGSIYNAAAKLGPLTDQLRNTYLPLANALIVENRTASFAANSLPQPSCLAADSNIGGDISAVGTSILTFITPTSINRLSGTSLSSPQVAGLASWMLAVRPALSISDLRARILNTSRTDPCAAAPMMDAFAALLSLDIGPSDAPVRLAMLQPTKTVPKATFNMEDTREFLKVFYPEHYAPGQSVPVQPDLSRFDLNGDGYTGDRTRRAPFDLKFNGSSAQFIPTSISFYEFPLNTPITGLHENAVTDFEVLCYYVNSPLFDQSEKLAFEKELVAISQDPAINRKVSCNDRIVTLNVNATQSGWVGLPAKLVLSNFSPTFPATPVGNSATCTNQGEPSGERGTPLFSKQVPSPISIFAVIDVVGVPSQLGREPNRRNCSSFFASAGQQVWINATGRTVFGFGGGIVSDWEYQVRYSNGDASGVGKQCTVGVVPGIGIFSPAFTDSTCTHQESSKISE